jgi:hypothetical protein
MPETSIKSFFFQNLFTASLTFIGLISLVLLWTRHQADLAVLILEGIFMGYASICYWWTKRAETIPSSVIIRWGCFLYVVLSYIYAVDYRKANFLDFLLIYKSFVYLFFLTFLTNKKLMTYTASNRFTIVIFSLFFLKYLATIGLGISDRPILFMENNFELMFLYALYLIRYSVTKEKYLLFLGLVGIITLLSLSRASLLMYCVLVVFVIYDSFKKTRVFIIPVAGVILGALIIYIFSQRSSSLEEIDRFRFMLVWWSNVQHWGVLDWLFGAERITPLSVESCKYMSYFKNLFSYEGDGTCYSVILHSFIFRVIYDHGILGLIAIIWATYLLLVKSKLRKDAALVFITIVFINGLSVSSFNNLFFAISMVFLMTTNLEFQNTEEQLSTDEFNDEESLIPEKYITNPNN